MNKVFLIGNLTRDPELRTTQAGVNVCNFSIAVNRRYKNAQTGKQETDYFTVQAWRGLADICAQYLAKGRKVSVTGSMQMRTYDAQDGTKRTRYDVVADEVEFMSSGQGSAAQQQAPAQTYTAPAAPPRRQDAHAEAQRMAAQAATMHGAADDFAPADIDNDDLPF